MSRRTNPNERGVRVKLDVPEVLVIAEHEAGADEKRGTQIMPANEQRTRTINPNTQTN
jgi:hypothetical protein